MLLGLLDRHGRLDPSVVPLRPGEAHALDLPGILQAHLSHPANSHLIPELDARTRGHGLAANWLLRILAAPLFAPADYRQVQPIGRGAFATVSQRYFHSCLLQPHCSQNEFQPSSINCPE